jgi:Ca2+-transporting ATPase
MAFYTESIDDILHSLNSTKNGLTAAEVKRRQKEYGFNTITITSEPWWKKVLEPFLDVFTLVLVIAALISLWHGEMIDAIIILTIIILQATVFYVQRFSTDRVLRSLARHDTQKVDVLRAGQTVLIDSSQLVPGDIIMLSEGEKVPADLRLIRADNVRADESQLTGESLPIGKNNDTLKSEKEIYEQTNMLFQGSFVVSGMATGIIVATGNNTEFGNLAALSKPETVKSPVQKKIDKLITKIIAVVAAASVVAFGLSLLRGTDFFESMRFVMAMAVSAVPEGLPIASSMVLVLGMRRMAAKKALVHHMRAIETLGVITTIATDKTGTLTKNKLTVQETWTPDQRHNIHQIITHAINHGDGKSHDPLDIALEQYARKNGRVVKGSPAIELPFNQEMSMSATVWHHGTTYRLYAKGAPEHIMARCKPSAAQQRQAEQALDDFATQGYRVIGLASCEIDASVNNFSQLSSVTLEFAGFVAVADELRPEAARAIRAASKAGVSVRMITGDHFETAYQIGKQLGMVETRDEVFDCRHMSKLSDEELDEIVERTKVFSRVIPEQKYRILTVLKKHNITAMTGDGVNDVPALTNAHIGVAMGSGSHIAKDAGDIILLDDNFKTIIDAMREGRTIIANVKRILFYLLSTNTGEMITMLGALLIGIKTPLEPVQILWVNLVTDTAMVIPLGLEPGEKNAMKQPPQKPNAPILNRTMIWRMVIIALTMSVIALGVYIFFDQRYGHDYAQTMAFVSLVVSQWANAFNARSDSESVFTRIKVMNKSFYIGLAISVLLQSLVLFGPLSSVLHISPVSHWHLVIVCLLSFIIPILTCEWHKKYRNR